MSRKPSTDDAARDAARVGLPNEARGPPRQHSKDTQVPLDIPIPAKDAQKAAGDKSIAGRHKVNGGQKWDMATGKEAPLHQNKDADEEDKTVKSPEEHDVEVELNSILKKGPSKP